MLGFDVEVLMLRFDVEVLMLRFDVAIQEPSHCINNFAFPCRSPIHPQCFDVRLLPRWAVAVPAFVLSASVRVHVGFAVA